MLPLPVAMVLHAVTQMASNGWRAFLWWRHIQWRITVFYVMGCFIAVGIWSLTLYVPEKAIALLMLGVSPFLLRIVPAKLMPGDTLGPVQALGGGVACMALMLLTGVTGPLMDQLFLRSPMNRHQIVATKASCQVFGHGSKLLYFGATDRGSRLGRALGAGDGRRCLHARHVARQDDPRTPVRRPVPHLGGPADHGAGSLLCRLWLGSAGRDCLRWRVDMSSGISRTH